MKLKLAVVGVAAALILGALPVWAHHSFAAEYDNTKPLKLTGKFTSMDWTNPHSWVHFDVVGADGKVTSWRAETPPPNGLYRNGWRKDSFKVGEPVEVSGFAAKDGSPMMWSNGVKLINSGVTLGLGSRPPEEGATPGAPVLPAATKGK
ncbi:MAG: DUF6152 family protein [Acidobacteriota bacterium]